jgi:hypothetical protein
MTNGPLSSVSAPAQRGARRRRWWKAVALFAAAWAVLAYLVAPRIWELVTHHRADIAQAQHLTTTSDGHAGDPVNLVLIGTETELVNAMQGTGWSPADPITLETSLRIAADSILRRPDPDAPVSDLFLFGRKQDLAYEQPVGNSPRQRHHVRFWRWDRTDDGQPRWFGAATFDERVGLSYTTGQVTHHIAADVDAERDRIVRGLGQSGCIGGTEWLDGFHREREGRNGGGDVWRTDGRLAAMTLKTCRAAKA